MSTEENKTKEVTIEPSITTEAFCVKCRAKHPIKEPHLEVLKNRKYAISGQCGTCGKGVYKIISNEEGKRMKEKEEEGSK